MFGPGVGFLSIISETEKKIISPFSKFLRLAKLSNLLLI